MAKSDAVWGIDIGQCALKALRGRISPDDPEKIEADAFDYIEYPKILSQPDADPAELIAEAIETFLSRNSVKGDRVAISVSGQSGLARFIKLPPVESKKIPDIVKYEARQQIPFPLEDVVWDFQQMAGGSVEDGFALETEVGLFAMKRDQAFRAMRPFQEADIEVDFIQLAPLTIYNFTVFDQLQDLPPAEEYDAENPPKSAVVISMGTDSTDLVITNGFRVWQRSLAIGGSQFTKALMKELKLTFAKAEHLKKNATAAPDHKAVFQAMRPVFNDLVTDVQRSIGFFSNIDRNAEIGRVIPLGNAMRLPGLQKYLGQNLGYPVTEVKRYRNLVGEGVVDAPEFQENLLSFAVCYGLVLQGTGLATLGTNLLPPEITTERLVRSKKPWAVAAVALLLVGCTINFFGYWRAWSSVHPAIFDQPIAAADTAKSTADRQRADFAAAKAAFELVKGTGEKLVGNVDGRLVWIEMLKGMMACFPADKTEEAATEDGKREPHKKPIAQREELHLDDIEVLYMEKLEDWYNKQTPINIAAKLQDLEKDIAAAKKKKAGNPPPLQPAPDAPAAEGAAPEGAAPAGDGAPAPPAAAPGGEGVISNSVPPSGPGWVVTIRGYHYHNEATQPVQGYAFVRDTLLTNLREKKDVKLPDRDGELVDVTMEELGVTHALLTSAIRPYDQITINDPNAPVGTENPEKIKLNRFNFEVQFVWRERPLSKRLQDKQAPAASPDANLADR